ncbi:MAG: hypothetical protein AAF492_18700 [Verrucomicrobiota bacterium]
MKDLEQKLKEHYESMSLPTSRLDEILEQTPEKPAAISRRTIVSALAAALLIGLGLVWFGARHADVTGKVVAEVVYNHKKQGELLVQSDQYTTVQAELDRLDFSLLSTRPSVLEDYTLVGGKYCSVQGHPAAQLKLLNKTSGAACTLYVARWTDPRNHVRATRQNHEGVLVEIWTEKDRLFAIAGE